MKNLLNFRGWESVNEADGFGTSPFLLKKEKDQYNYFFNLEDKKEENKELNRKLKSIQSIFL